MAPSPLTCNAAPDPRGGSIASETLPSWVYRKALPEPSGCTAMPWEVAAPASRSRHMPASCCWGWADVVDGGGRVVHRGGIELMLPALTGLGEVEGMHLCTRKRMVVTN